MNNENKASISAGNLNNSTFTGGKINTPQGRGNTINDVSINVKDVTNSDFQGSEITVHESIDIAKLKAELKAEIQPLLEQLAATTLATDQDLITGAIIGKIKANPTLKERFLNALKAGSIEALKEIFKHPIVNICAETVKGSLEPG